jgi:glycosyltransferase involved in cell wall biosynthesis
MAGEADDLPLIALVDASSKMAGVEFSTLYLAQHLDRSRFRVVVVCPEEGDLPERCRAAGIDVVIEPAPRFIPTGIEIGRAYIPNPLSWLVNPLLLIGLARRHAALYRRLDAALICTKGVFAHLYGTLAAKIAGRPAVIHMQDLLANPLYIRAFGMFARLARRIIADGAPIRDQLAPFVGAERVDLIYNGVDLEQFSAAVSGAGVRAEWGVDSDAILIGNAARLTAWKGQDVLLKAFIRIAPDYPRAKLALIGSPVFHGDAFEAALRRLAAESGLADRIIFAGFRWDLPQVLAALDIFVYPSIRKDTSPLSLVSALASGLPTAASDVGGVAELLTHERDGLIVPAADVDALVVALRRMLDDPDLRKRLGAAARQTAERSLSLSAFARRCESVFERARCLTSDEG